MAKPSISGYFVAESTSESVPLDQVTEMFDSVTMTESLTSRSEKESGRGCERGV